MKARLEEALDQLRDALVAGNLSAISGYADEIEALIVSLPAMDQSLLERLRRKACRNERLLSSAGLGVRAALHRIAEIKSRATLATYDARGRREFIASPSAATLRRV